MEDDVYTLLGEQCAVERTGHVQPFQMLSFCFVIVLCHCSPNVLHEYCNTTQQLIEIKMDLNMVYNPALDCEKRKQNAEAVKLLR